MRGIQLLRFWLMEAVPNGASSCWIARSLLRSLEQYGLDTHRVRFRAFVADDGRRDLEQLDALRKTWRDRFGKTPQAVENLLLMAEIKLAAAARKITGVEIRDGKVMLTRAGDFILIGGKFPRVTKDDPSERLQEVVRVVRSF